MKSTKSPCFLAKVLACVVGFVPAGSAWTSDADALRSARTLLSMPVGYAGLSCGQCLYSYIAWCASLPKVSAIAVAQGAKQVAAVKRDCFISTDIGDYSPCNVSGAYEFERMTFVTNTQRVNSEDQFVADYSYDHYRPLNKQGVALDADKTYLIFAFRRPQKLRPEAPWDIPIACEISNDVADAVINQTQLPATNQ